jgi:hypothetical protein
MVEYKPLNGHHDHSVERGIQIPGSDKKMRMGCTLAHNQFALISVSGSGYLPYRHKIIVLIEM